MNLKGYLNKEVHFAHVLLRSDIDLTKPKNNNRLYYKDNTKTLIYKYEIPPVTTNNKKFPLSGLLAIIDEFTSWAISYEDKKSRLESVSTLLEVKVGFDYFLNESKAGDIVELRGR